MRKKPYVSQKRFYLGGRRKQKGGFLFPLLAFKLGTKLIGGMRKRRRARAIW